MPDLLRAVGLGAGGHGKVMVEALRAMGGFRIVCFIDPRDELWGTEVAGVEVIGGDDLLGRQYDAGVRHIFIGLGGADDTRPRMRLYERALAAGFTPISTVHPHAVLSPSARLGEGVSVLAGAVLNADAEVGANVIVNTAAVVEHDCRLGDHAHVATGARLASGVSVGRGVHVGAGATVLQGLHLGEGAVVGAGAVVIGDVEDGVVVVGVPARVLRRVES